MLHSMKKSSLLLALIFVIPVSLSAQKQYLQISNFRVPNDSLAQVIGQNFWRILCEELAQNPGLRLVSTKDQIYERGNFIPGIHHIPDVLVHPDSTEQKAALLPIRGALGFTDTEYEISLRIGKQASDSGRVTRPKINDESETLTDLRRIVSEALRQLRPEFARQQAWLGAPLDPEKFHILVADFNAADTATAQAAADQFQKQLLAASEQYYYLRLLFDVQRLPAARARIKNETDALEIGKSLDVDAVVCGDVRFSPDSLSHTTQVCLTHPNRFLRTEVLQARQTTAIDSIPPPDVSLIQFLLAVVHLNDPAEESDSLALHHLNQAYAAATPENQQKLNLLAANTAYDAVDFEKMEYYVQQFAPEDSFAIAYGHLFHGSIYKKDEQPDSAREAYLRAAKIFNQLQLDEKQAQIFYLLGKLYYENDELDSAEVAFQKSMFFYAAADKKHELAIASTYLGAIYQKNKMFDQAEAAFKNALPIFLEKNHRSSLARLYRFLASLYYQQDKKAQALVCYKKAIQIGVEEGDHDALTTLYRYAGLISYQLGQLDQSLKFFEKYLTLTRSEENPAYRGQTHSYLGFLYNKKGNRVKSIKNFELAIDAFQAEGDTSHLASTFKNLGQVYFAWGDFRQAEKYLLKSAALQKTNGDLASVYKSLGGLHYQQGNPAQALGHYQTAAVLCHEAGDSTELVTLYKGTAMIHYQRGDSAQAIEYYRKSAAIQSAQGDQNGLAATLSNIGRIFYAQSNWDSARVCFEQAAKIRTEAGLIAELSRLYQNIGICWSQLGETARQVKFYEKAAAAAKRAGNAEQQAKMLTLIGVIHRNDEAYETALKYFLEAAEIFPADTPDLAKAYQNIGYIYFKQEQWNLALDYLLWAKDGFNDAGDLKRLMEVYFILSEIYSKFGDSFATRECAYKNDVIYYLLNKRETLSWPYYKLARLKLQQRKFEDAEAYARLAILQGESVSESDFDLQEKVTLFNSLMRQDKHEQAIALVEAGFIPDADLSDSQAAYPKFLLLEAQLKVFLRTGRQFPELSEFLATAPALEQAQLFSRARAWKRAAEYYHTFLQQAPETLAGNRLAQVQTEIATCFLEQNQADSALNYLKPALNYYEQSGDSLKLAQVQAQIGAAYKIQKKWKPALALLRQSRQIHWKISSEPRPELGETLFHLADVFHQTAEPDSAAIYARKSLEFTLRAREAEKAYPVQDLIDRIDAVAEK